MAAEEVLIIGGGIGGLTLALQLAHVGVPTRVLEAVPELQPLGVGINLLPHASKELWRLGLEEDLSAIGLQTSQAVFYNRFGQFIHVDPAGRSAGFPWPQYSIHRGELQFALARRVRERLGENALVLGARVVGLEDDGAGVSVTAESLDGSRSTFRGSVAVGCDGVHSVVRKHLHPDEGALLYTGYTMWRGTTRMQPFLDGASMARVGWLETGKLVIYPILDYPDGTQLINWVAEVKLPQRTGRDWSQLAHDEDALHTFLTWTFDWLDIPAMIRGAEKVYEYPMVDQDPLPFWTRGGITLLGDAAHPMVPRGSNGAGQAVLDTRALADALVDELDPRAALARYEAERLPRTAEVVRLNRANPPDALLREVYERTGDTPFDDIVDVISQDEMREMLERYRTVTGSSLQALTNGSTALA